jgi:hypothetical protein
MSTTTTTQPDQAFYTVKQLSSALSQRGMTISNKSIRDYINAGRIKASRELMRPKLWVVSHQELLRLMNQGQ